MGAKLNSAASGGVDYGRLAAAVHGYTVESGLTFEEVTRIIAAALAGTTERPAARSPFKGPRRHHRPHRRQLRRREQPHRAVLDGS